TDASHSEGGWKYSMFGKSGTAEIPLTPPPGKNLRRPKGTSGYFDDQYNSSFIAGGPAEDPKLVVLCVIDDPGPALIRAKKHYGTYVAGPVVRRVMERSLDYLGVAPSPVPPSTAAGPTRN
ncbi:MAG TPA: penicillin-binding transpeptidase domain-containing protein, partial [Phycisphaerales bacterium]|nr:penicillin-binding transpeptidase domain-containing protein [Phycisphaerales bacterium]